MCSHAGGSVSRGMSLPSFLKKRDHLLLRGKKAFEEDTYRAKHSTSASEAKTVFSVFKM